MMELCCYMFQLKPKKDNIGKVEGDTLGFFHMGKTNLLKDPNKFKEDLINFDKEHIPPEVVKKANTILLANDLTIDDVKNASAALLGIYKWAGAMTKYYELLKIVNPKREQVKIMKEKLKIVQAELDKKNKKLLAVQAKLDELEAKMIDMKEKERDLNSKIESCNLKLERANKIIEGLSGEKQQWTDTVAQLTLEYDLLIGNCLVAAGMVAYSGSFTMQFRA